MPLDPESLYRQLGQLIAETPSNLDDMAPLPGETLQWLGRAALLVEQTGDIPDQAMIKVASNSLGGVTCTQNAHQILAVLYRALARAEMNAPMAAQGAFIPAGAGFDSLQAVGKVLTSARQDILIVDPYMSAIVLTDFAPLVPAYLTLRLLTDAFYTKDEDMRPPVLRWKAQYGDARPLEIRFTSPRLLHDRLVVTDNNTVWSLTQSLKDFAGRSPASIVRLDGEPGRLKREAFESFWANARALQ